MRWVGHSRFPSLPQASPLPLTPPLTRILFFPHIAYASTSGSKASSGPGSGVLLEISMGMIDRGADLKWLSQYPHEAEILVRLHATERPWRSNPPCCSPLPAGDAIRSFFSPSSCNLLFAVRYTASFVSSLFMDVVSVHGKNSVAQ